VKREDFMFAVGFDGATAVVDGAARRRHGRASVAQLLEAGLFRPAACAALWDDDDTSVAQVIEAVNRASGAGLAGREDLVRLFGVPVQVLKDQGRSAALAIKVQVI
jgi:hypothetical protein